MKYFLLIIYCLTIMTFGCLEKENPKEKKEVSKDPISIECEERVRYLKNNLHLENQPKSHFLIFESNSYLLNEKSIKQILIDFNVVFPLIESNIFISDDNFVEGFSYIEYKNINEYYTYYFSIDNQDSIEFDLNYWINKIYTSEKKDEIIDRCLNVNEYCVLIVKTKWKPYLESLQSVPVFYNIERRIYDSLLIEWNKQDLINK